MLAKKRLWSARAAHSRFSLAVTAATPNGGFHETIKNKGCCTEVNDEVLLKSNGTGSHTVGKQKCFPIQFLGSVETRVRFPPPPLIAESTRDHLWPVSSLSKRGETGHFHERRKGRKRTSEDTEGPA